MTYPVQITERDRCLLQMVASYRAVTIAQLRRRFFATPGARSAGYARVQRLIQARYLAAQRLGSISGIGSGKLLITLGRRGRRLVAALPDQPLASLGRAPRLRALGTIAHHLAIGDVRLSFELAITRSRHFRQLVWRSEHELAGHPLRIPDPETQQTLSWIPDGALELALADGRTQAFLLERDRGTIPGKRLRPKLRAYLHQVPSLPVLFILPDERRQAAIRSWTLTEAARIGADPTLIWLTIADQVTETTVLERPIWQVAGGPATLALTALVNPPDPARAAPQSTSTDQASDAAPGGRA